MKRALWFDLATRTGYCHDDSDGMPVAGIIKLPKVEDDDYGAVWWALRERAMLLISHWHPDAIGFEAAIADMARIQRKGKAVTNTHTLRLLRGLVCTIECLAAELEIPCFERDARTIKKHFTGDGLADKAAMVKMCQLLKIDVKGDHNAADGVAGWTLLKSLLDQKWAPRATPLFVGR